MRCEAPPAMSCCFCGGGRPVRTHTAVFHPFKKDHGPFDFYRCADCGSGLTLPPPSRNQLNRLYESFIDGYATELREMMSGDPQLRMYGLQVRRMLRHARRAGAEPRTWIDVGAGGGEISRLLAQALPAARGSAIDLHDSPPTLAACERVDWRRVDINDDNFSAAVGPPADLVVSSAVWEHVLLPRPVRGQSPATAGTGRRALPDGTRLWQPRPTVVRTGLALFRTRRASQHAHAARREGMPAQAMAEPSRPGFRAPHTVRAALPSVHASLRMQALRIERARRAVPGGLGASCSSWNSRSGPGSCLGDRSGASTTFSPRGDRPQDLRCARRREPREGVWAKRSRRECKRPRR